MKIIEKINSAVDTLLTSRHSQDIEEIGRKKLFVLFLTLLILPLIVFGTGLIRDNVYDQGIIDYIVALVLIALIVVLSYQKNGKYIYRIAAIFLVVFLFFISINSLT